MKTSAKIITVNIMNLFLAVTFNNCKHESKINEQTSKLSSKAIEELNSKANDLCYCYVKLEAFINMHGDSPEPDSLKNELIDLAQFVMQCEEEARIDISTDIETAFDSIFIRKCPSAKLVY